MRIGEQHCLSTGQKLLPMELRILMLIPPVAIAYPGETQLPGPPAEQDVWQEKHTFTKTENHEVLVLRATRAAKLLS